MTIIDREMTRGEQFDCFMLLLSLLAHAGFLWFNLEDGRSYATNTAFMLICIVNVILFARTLDESNSLAQAANKIRTWAALIIPLAAFFAVLSGREVVFNAIYLLGNSFLFLLMYFLFDMIFLRNWSGWYRIFLTLPDDDVDETGSVEAMQDQYPGR